MCKRSRGQAFCKTVAHKRSYSAMMESNRSATLGDILQRSEVERAEHDIFPSESTWSPWVTAISGIRALRFSSRGGRNNDRPPPIGPDR